MDAFMGRTIDGLLPVAPSITKGNPISRVKWVFDYKTDDNGDPLEKARLVWAHNEGNRPGGTEFRPLTMSNVVKPMHWKMLVHVAMVDGAKIKRFDIANAHQSSRRSPNDPPTRLLISYSRLSHVHSRRGRSERAMDKHAEWNAGGRQHVREGSRGSHGKPRDAQACVIQDDLVWIHNELRRQPQTGFQRRRDDILCIYKGDAADEYEKHLSKRWTVKKMELDG
jgi:hypothetical protein